MASKRRQHWLNVVFPDSIDFPGNTQGVVVPSGTISERPLTPSNGLIRYNITNNTLEAYINGIWEKLGTGAASGNTFIDLTDTISSYTGKGNELLRVNAAETGVDSWDIGTGFIPNAGGVLDSGANITMNGGEVVGLPPMPTTAGSAASKTYVDSVLSTSETRIQDGVDNDSYVDTSYGSANSEIVKIQAGNNSSNGQNGGDVLIGAGSGLVNSPTGTNGGNIFITSGSSGYGTTPSSSGDGGDISLTSASATSGGNGGGISLLAGDGDVGGDIVLTPGGGTTPGTVNLGSASLKFPNTDGNAGEVLATDGAGVLSFTKIPYDLQTYIPGTLGTSVVTPWVWMVARDGEVPTTGHHALTLTAPTGNDVVFTISRFRPSDSSVEDFGTITFAANISPAIGVFSFPTQKTFIPGDIIRAILTTPDSNDVISNISIIIASKVV